MRYQWVDQGHRRTRCIRPFANLLPMVEVGAYTTRSDAELAQGALEAAGIPSVIVADDAGGAYPFDLTGAVRLLVVQADAKDAATVLSGDA